MSGIQLVPIQNGIENLQHISKRWTKFEIPVPLQPQNADEWNSYHLKEPGTEFQIITASLSTQMGSSLSHSQDSE